MAAHSQEDGATLTDCEQEPLVAPAAQDLGDDSFNAQRFLAERLLRNAEILSDEEQAAALGMRVLVAGCGTVGGSIVEPLARLGVTDFVLADPEAYDVTNLNRQAGYLQDVGKSKAAVLAERVAAVNPGATARTFLDGIREHNVDAAFDGVTIVFDGVDAFVSLWEKFLVHKVAANRGIPVISGVDYGGKPALYVFDYRRDPRPFYGRGNEADHREGRVLASIAWIGRWPFPIDFAPVVANRVKTARPWPQVSYCALGLAALGSRLMIDVAARHRVPDVVDVDIHMRTRTLVGRVAQYRRLPAAVVQTAHAMRRAKKEGFGYGREAMSDTTESGSVEPTIEAIRRAEAAIGIPPSFLRHIDAEHIEVVAEGPATAQPGHNDWRKLQQSIGCVIEAANWVARIDPDVQTDSSGQESGRLKTVLRLKGLRPDFDRRIGVIRSLKRAPARLMAVSPDAALRERLADTVASHDLRLDLLTEPEELMLVAPLVCAIDVSQEATTGDRAGPLSKVLVDMGFGRLIKTFQTHRVEWDISCGGAVAVLSLLGDGFLNHLAVGRALTGALLVAARENWAFRPLPLTTDQQPVSQALRELVALPEEWSPIVVARLGRALLRPRRRWRLP